MPEISNELLDRLEVDDMLIVVSDVLNDIDPEDSKLDYNDDLLAYREIAEAEAAAIPKGQFVDIPKV